jgi:pimeloyl-ACP methyl ester carboxylesterase
MSAYRDDTIAVARQLPAPPVLVGASLGGMASMVAAAEAESIARGLVLVDITPRVEREGVARIHAFMTARPDGFASLDEAADAVAAYNPERPRPADSRGLLKNLRLRDDRYFWHWDPAMLGHGEAIGPEYAAELEAAAQKVRVPTRLVRGLQSDIVSDETVAHMRELIPHADFVDIGGAGHMVAGDRNDAFNAAVFSFLEKHGL